MNVLTDNKELLKYIEIWDKIVDLFNKKHNKRVLYKSTIYNESICNKCIKEHNKRVLYGNTIYNECIKTKISPYNEMFLDNRKLIKDRCCGNSILLIESICNVENSIILRHF